VEHGDDVFTDINVVAERSFRKSDMDKQLRKAKKIDTIS
jgi:hypothetical protein